jgi:anti-sigma factor RsiW
MGHWLHMLLGRDRVLAADAADEGGASARRRVEGWLLACPGCRERHRAYRAAIAATRAMPGVRLTAEEGAFFWPAVARRIAAREPAPARRPRPWIREVLWDHPRLGVASAATAALFVLGLTLAQLGVWGPMGTSALGGVEVVEVDVGEDASVMVFEVPGSGMTVIWIFEDRSS